MKTKILRDVFLTVIMTVTFPSLAQNPAPSKEETITKSPLKTVINPNLLQARPCGPPLPFKRFEMVDLTTGQPIAGTAKITLSNGEPVPAQQYYDEVNSLEKWLTEHGCSLRTTSPDSKTVIAEIRLNHDLIERQLRAAPTPTQLPRIENFWEPLSARPIRFEGSDLAKSGVDIKADRGNLDKINRKISGAGVEGIMLHGLAIGPSVGEKIARILACQVCPPPPPCTPINDSNGWNWNIGDPSTFAAYINVSLTRGGNCCMPPDMNNFNNNQSHFAISGEAKAGGYVFGAGGDIIRATANVGDDRSNNTESAALGIFVLGEEVFSKNETATGHWQSQDTISKGVDFSSSFTIGLGPFGIDITAGARGSAGFQYSISLDPMTVSLSAEPFIHTNVYAQGGLSAGIAEAGVRVNLTLLDWDMRLNARTGVGWHIYGSVAYDDVYADSDLNLLKGSLDAYVKACIWLPILGTRCSEWDANLWSWDGLQFNSVLLDQRHHIALPWGGLRDLGQSE